MMFPELEVDGRIWRCVYEVPMLGSQTFEFGYLCPEIDRNVQLRVDKNVFIAAEDMAFAMCNAIREANNNFGGPNVPTHP